MKFKLVAILSALFVLLGVLTLSNQSAGAQVVDRTAAAPVSGPVQMNAAAFADCRSNILCGRIRNGDGEDRFRITYGWGTGCCPADRDLYPGQNSWGNGDDADGYRIGKCWRAHEWRWSGGERWDYGYVYGPGASSSSPWTWFKVADSWGFPASDHVEVNGLVRVC